MTDQWIVRVQNREYGPVGVEELLEWKREGRLIRENEVREANSERWFPAGELPEIFGDELSQANKILKIDRLLAGFHFLDRRQEGELGAFDGMKRRPEGLFGRHVPDKV